MAGIRSGLRELFSGFLGIIIWLLKLFGMFSGKHKGRDQVYFHRRIAELARQGRPVPDVVPYPGDKLRLVVRNQLVVHLESPLPVQFRELLLGGRDVRQDQRRERVKAKVIRVCHCNPNLVLLEGEQGTEAHLLEDLTVRYSPDTDQPPPQVKSSSANDVRYSPDTDQPPPQVKSSGDGSGVPIPIVPASFDFQLRRIAANSDQWSEYPIVAVMDSGIDFAYPNLENIPILYNGGRPMCGSIEPDYIGWDFVHDHNNPYDDDSRNKHGSRIAAIISRERDVRILPLKVIDSEGFGLLFNIFCSFEYLLADHLREKSLVVNASWGFYAESENRLMTDYMNRFRRNRIWFVNAAGNRGDIRKNETVSLNQHTRFPACYSYRYPNVITVTTVSKNQDSEFGVVENYSPTFVNVGIGSGKDGMFEEPLVSSNALPPVKGSSYATPYASAYAAKSRLSPGDYSIRDQLLKAMPDEDEIKALTPFIAQGSVVPVET